MALKRLTLLACLLPSLLLAQQNEVVLYDGDLSKAKGLKLGSWGSGFVEETDEVKFENRNSLSIFTDGFYAGGKLEWAPPKEVRGLLGKKFAYIRLKIFVPGLRPPAPAAPAPGAVPGAPPGMPGAMPGMPGVPAPGMPGAAAPEMGVPPGAMPPGMPGAPQMPGMPGAYPGMAGPGAPPYPGAMGPETMGPEMAGMGMPPEAYPMPPGAMPQGPEMMPPGMPEMPGMPGAPTERRERRPIESLRILIQTDKGWLALPPLKIDPGKMDQRGWIDFVVPLAKMVKIGQVDEKAKLRRLLIFGDKWGEFYVGQISLVHDPQPIKVSATAQVAQQPPKKEIDCMAGETVRFSAEVESGLAEVEVFWDFDARDGVKPEAEGESVEHKFEKPGTYKVTVVAVDKDGVKEEARDTVIVHVHPTE